jgi:hypothetical protein
VDGWVLRLDRDGRPLGEWPLSGAAVTVRLVDPATGREAAVLTLTAPDTLPVPAAETTRILGDPGELFERATVPLPLEAQACPEDAGTERRAPVPPPASAEEGVTAATRCPGRVDARDPAPCGVDEVPWIGGGLSDDDPALPLPEEDGSTGR